MMQWCTIQEDMIDADALLCLMIDTTASSYKVAGTAPHPTGLVVFRSHNNPILVVFSFSITGSKVNDSAICKITRNVMYRLQICQEMTVTCNCQHATSKLTVGLLIAQVKVKYIPP